MEIKKVWLIPYSPLNFRNLVFTENSGFKGSTQTTKNNTSILLLSERDKKESPGYKILGDSVENSNLLANPSVNRPLKEGFTQEENEQQKLNQKHYRHCCGDEISKKQRGLDPKWVKANCYSADIKEASEMLYYQAKSPGIIIVGQNGQYQFRPDKPWADKQGKKAPKYRTARGDEFDALLLNHPDDPNFWNNLEKLKDSCYQINGRPYIVITEGASKAISAMMHRIPTVALLGVEMGLTPAHIDPQGKRYLVPALELLAKAGFGFILAFDADISRKGPVRLAMVKLAHQLLKFKVPVRVLPEWDEQKGKGIDDYIQMNGIEKFRQELIARAIKFEKWSAIKNNSSEELRENSHKSNKIPKADILGGEIAEEYRSRWVFCDEYKNWMG